MAELKVYSGGPDDNDQAATQELKRFSQEKQGGPRATTDHEQEVMLRASAEVERRTKKAMLYSNLDYFEASRRVIQSDLELAELYARGYVRE